MQANEARSFYPRSSSRSGKAAGKGYTAAIEALVKAGAEVNVAIRGGWTPLHAAVSRTEWRAVKALLKAGADVNAADSFGDTPLSIGANRAEDGHKALYKALLDAKKNNVNAVAEYGWTQHLPRLRQAAWKYYNPNSKAGITERIADRVIAAFLKEISIPLPQKKLAFAKLFNTRLSQSSPGNDLSVDILFTIGQMLAAKPKRTNPEIMENFAKIMAALDTLQDYKKGHEEASFFRKPDIARANAAKAIQGAILRMTESGETINSLEQIISKTHGSPQVFQAVFKTTNFGQGLTALQEKLGIIARWLNDGADYSTPERFAGLKAKIEKDAPATAEVSAAEPEAQAAEPEAQAVEPATPSPRSR